MTGGRAWVGKRTESTAFGRLRIDFDPSVLRPRPWTVAQSRWAAEQLEHVPAGPVLELCAGAGQIGLLAVADADRDVVLVDIDETACSYALANAGHAGLTHRVKVRRAALHEAVAPHERFTLVLADPPWVPSGSVGRFPEDPRRAIDGGRDGMSTAWACLEVIDSHLADEGVALIQLGTIAQVAAMRARLGAGRPPRLEVAESRAHGDRGVLVLLRRC